VGGLPRQKAAGERREDMCSVLEEDLVVPTYGSHYADVQRARHALTGGASDPYQPLSG